MTRSKSSGPLGPRASFFSFFIFVLLFAVAGGAAQAQVLFENFDTVTDNDPAPIPGWIAINHSEQATSTMWFQGNPDVFPSWTGAPESYIGGNFQSTNGDSTINLWLLTPQRTFNNGDVVRFYTQTVPSSIYPDRLQVRLSTAGASQNVGVGPEGVGDFSRLLLDINPTLQPGGYPEYWQQFRIVITGLTGSVSGRLAFRYYVTHGGPSGANSNYIGIDAFSVAHPAAHQECDFNGDGVTDATLVRNTGGGQNGQVTWFSHTADFDDFIASWGIASDSFEPGDYDGDNSTDMAVWRQGAPGIAAYHIFRSSDSTYMRVPIGQTGDNPDVHGDYDGDGKADAAVFGSRPETGNQAFFYFVGSLNNPSGAVSYRAWGLPTDFPFPGDFDGDGRSDLAVQRNGGGGFGRMWIQKSSGPMETFIWGTPTDFVAPGDYDGDGKTDVTTVRSAAGGQFAWYVRSSLTSPSYNFYAPTAYFGASETDFITQGDYDGDGRTDIAIWRPDDTSFYWQGSASGFNALLYGLDVDYPPANWNVH